MVDQLKLNMLASYYFPIISNYCVKLSINFVDKKDCYNRDGLNIVFSIDKLSVLTQLQGQ